MILCDYYFTLDRKCDINLRFNHTEGSRFHQKISIGSSTFKSSWLGSIFENLFQFGPFH